MNLVRVTGKPFYVYCCKCQASLYAGTETYTYCKREPDVVFADIDGEPFKAYYCEPCAQSVAQVERMLEKDTL